MSSHPARRAPLDLSLAESIDRRVIHIEAIDNIAIMLHGGRFAAVSAHDQVELAPWFEASLVKEGLR